MYRTLKTLSAFLLGTIVWMSTILATSMEPDSRVVLLKKAVHSAGNIANPVAAAIGDYDEDGVPDLAVVHSGGLTLYRGNPDTIYQNSSEAQERRRQNASVSNPLLSDGKAIFLSDKADFAGSGDFNGDGHLDLVTAAKGYTALFFLPGDGNGGFAIGERIELFARITALGVGDINRRDGLNDVVVGIEGKEGSELLAFEGPDGAFKHKPERIPLEAEAAAIALGHLDDDSIPDIAVAYGSEIAILHGRDRKLSMEGKHQKNVPAATIERLGMPSAAKSIQIGDFTRDQRKEIAVLSVDGSVSYLERGKQWSLSAQAAHSTKELLSVTRISGSAKTIWYFKIT